MRKLVVSCGLLAWVLILVVQSPSIQVRAQEKTAAPKPKAQSSSGPRASEKVALSKEASIRQLMDLTGAKSLGAQMMQAGMEQFRASVTESEPNNPRAKQFIDAFVATFQKHFDPDSLTDKIIPIYDKYLSEEDVNGLLQYYKSPLGRRMLKALPEIARESQQTGFSLGQKATQETLEELKAEYPDFVSGKDKDEDSRSNAKPDHP
jgi:uncharacterized protein